MTDNYQRATQLWSAVRITVTTIEPFEMGSDTESFHESLTRIEWTLRGIEKTVIKNELWHSNTTNPETAQNKYSSDYHLSGL
jgi:hypothetical protein